MKVTRQQLLAYRIAEHGLLRTARDERELELFDLGVQDTSNATARLALAARLPRPAGDLAGVTLIRALRRALPPIEPWPAIPDEVSGIGRVITAYLRFFGPATPTEVAGFLGTTRKSVLPHWPDGLSEVDLEGKACWLPEERVDALRKPPDPP